MENNEKLSKNKWDEIIPKISASIILALFVNQLRSIFTIYNLQTWYLKLNLPFIAFNIRLMEIIWGVLLILVGVSFYFVWIRGFHRIDVKMALYYLVAMYILTLIGSGLLFGLQLVIGGFLFDIALIIVTIRAMRISNVVSKKSGWLLAPFLIWTVYLAILYLWILILN